MNYNESKLRKLIEVMNVDYVKDNPNDAYKLIQWLYGELNHRYDVIQLQREELLLCRAMIESDRD
jgi:hypothetical protein